MSTVVRGYIIEKLECACRFKAAKYSVFGNWIFLMRVMKCRVKISVLKQSVLLYIIVVKICIAGEL